MSDKLREAAQNLIDSMGPHQDLPPAMGAVDRLRAALADTAENVPEGVSAAMVERAREAFANVLTLSPETCAVEPWPKAIRAALQAAFQQGDKYNATADAPPEPTEEMVEDGMEAMGYDAVSPHGGMRQRFIKGLRAALAAAQKESG